MFSCFSFSTVLTRAGFPLIAFEDLSRRVDLYESDSLSESVEEKCFKIYTFCRKVFVLPEIDPKSLEVVLFFILHMIFFSGDSKICVF
jgi:hypothetical protein